MTKRERDLDLKITCSEEGRAKEVPARQTDRQNSVFMLSLTQVEQNLYFCVLPTLCFIIRHQPQAI